MNPKCAQCSKTVYPTEKLTCLDKIWHKSCFKCQACNMTLNMKNYKGYDKMPYCNAHYPQTKFTAVSDTPENRRISKNTQQQSAVAYHADFEKQKGQKTSVADDPETSRIKKNTENQSNVTYWKVREQRQAQEERRPNEQVADDVQVRSRNPGKISDYDPETGNGNDFASPYSQRSSANVVYDSQRGGEVHAQRVQPGSIADYDPMNQQRHSSTMRNSGGYPAQEPRGYQPVQVQANPQPAYAPQPARMPQPPPQQARMPQPPPQPAQIAYKALYDYTAADEDEVSFVEDDIIMNCEIIDEGWMTGTVKRTNQHGMLPSNYVERVM